MVTYQTGKGIGKDPNQTYYVSRFDSYSELVKLAQEQPNKMASDRKPTSNMNATRNFKEAYELAIHGWHDVRRKVDAAMEPIRQRLSDTLGVVTERTFDMVGFEPDIDRYLSGELECMVDDLFVEAPKQGNVFTLLVDASMAWSNSHEEVIARGATLCAMVEAFNMMGFQLDIWVETTVAALHAKHRGKSLATALVPISRAGDPLDIDQIMFAIGHPDFNRRIIWAYMEGVEDYREIFGYQTGGGYGLTRQGAHMNDFVDASVIVSLDGNYEMTRNPEAWILSQLELQGVVTSND